MINLGIKTLAMWLVVIGGLVWGVVGLTGSNPLEALGSIARIVYILVGLSALYALVDMLGMSKK